MNLTFTKTHASGNDFIILDCLKSELLNPSTVARELCKRHFSVGADGLIEILPSEVADARMKIFNADGGEAQMCGNAARCVGIWLYEREIVKKTRVTLETESGIKTLYLSVRDGAIVSVAVEMGTPTLGELFFFDAAGEKYEARAVNIGNDHQVVFTPDVDYIDLDRIGALFEKNPRFSDGANTEFCEILEKNHLKMRVFERGCGETLACGTGACAAAIAGILNGSCRAEQPININMRGGNVRVICDDELKTILIGDAKTVFKGSVEIFDE